jgi:hypothetical protein
MKFIIEDWAGNRCFPEKEFDNQQDADDFLLGAISDDEDLSEYFIAEKQSDVGDTHYRMASQIATAAYKIGMLMGELQCLADECHELGLFNTESDLAVALCRLGYAKDECLEHRTVAPLG